MTTAKLMGAHSILGIFEMLPETLLVIERERPAAIERQREEEAFISGEAGE